jgi:hypothetical protein
MEVKVAFSKLWLVIMIVILAASTTSAATIVYASHQKSSSDSSSAGSGSKGSDTSGGSSQGLTSSGSSSGSGSTPPSQSGNTLQSPGSTESQTSGPNPPGFPPSTPSQHLQSQPTCPNGEKPDSSGKCPSPSSALTPKGHTKDFGQGFGKGAEDGKVGVYDPAAACAGASNTAHCIQGYNDSYVASCTHGKFGCGDGPTTCTQGEKCVLPSSLPQPQPCKGNGICPSPPPPGPTPCKKGEVLINGKCVSLGSCHLIDNGTKFECSEEGGHTTIIERNTIQQVPIITSTNDINLFIVTTCTADQNNGVLNGNLAALCDSTITMMHNDGLDAQLPQVDLYLKARGLLQ